MLPCFIKCTASLEEEGNVFLSQIPLKMIMDQSKKFLTVVTFSFIFYFLYNEISDDVLNPAPIELITSIQH